MIDDFIPITTGTRTYTKNVKDWKKTPFEEREGGKGTKIKVRTLEDTDGVLYEHSISSDGQHELRKLELLPLMPSEQRKAAEELATSPQLLEQIQAELSKTIEGEFQARLVILLCAIGGLYLQNSPPASNNLIVNAESSTGKDHVTTNILDLFPKDRVYRRTRITPTTLTYWKPGKEDFTWDNKILSLIDISNTVLNCEVLKVLTTDGNHTTVTKDQKAVDIEIKGKPGIICTIATAELKKETVTRFALVWLDESNSQTRKVMQRIARSAAIGAKADAGYSQTVLDFFKILQNKRVVVPFAEKMVAFLPDHIQMRRHFNRVLQFIKASAVLHQYQREKTPQGELIANQQDYEIAARAVAAITTNAAMLPLSRDDKRIIDCLKTHDDSNASEINSQIGDISQANLYRRLGKLVSQGLVKSYSPAENEYGKKLSTRYLYQDLGSFTLPSWEKLQNE